jgi:hypothetical protein
MKALGYFFKKQLTENMKSVAFSDYRHVEGAPKIKKS